jgi:hypothetical protein
VVFIDEHLHNQLFRMKLCLFIDEQTDLSIYAMPVCCSVNQILQH